jgi:hypothetical protein
MNNVMIDLETMGTGPTAAIVAIGAVRFNRCGLVDTFYRNVSLRSSMSLGLKVDADTVMWWLQQGEEARAGLLVDQVHLAPALQAFTVWCGPDPIIWGNGAASDNVWLRSAYDACSMPAPWTFREDRCYRTVRAMHPNAEVKRIGTAHNVLDDAATQARHLIKLGALA